MNQAVITLLLVSVLHSGTQSLVTECHTKYGGFCTSLFTMCPPGYLQSRRHCMFLQACCFPEPPDTTSMWSETHTTTPQAIATKTTTKSPAVNMNTTSASTTSFSTTSQSTALTRTTLLSTIATSIPNNTSNFVAACGNPLISTNHRIVGGKETQIEAYPWQVSLHFNGWHLCGGTLLDDQWVLSAAHCFYNRTGNWEAVLGIGDITDPKGHIHDISDIFIPSDYNNTEINNDIAMFKLRKPVDLSGPSIRPACLPSPEDNFEHRTCTATGWGTLYYGGQGVKVLREVDMTVFSYRECKDQLGKNFMGEKLCAGHKYGGKTTCNGDSGGPLVVHDPAGWKVVGITSYGIECGWSNSPGVYTRVTSYLPWIQFIRHAYHRQ